MAGCITESLAVGVGDMIVTHNDNFHLSETLHLIWFGEHDYAFWLLTRQQYYRLFYIVHILHPSILVYFGLKQASEQMLKYFSSIFDIFWSKTFSNSTKQVGAVEIDAHLG